ncbi:MAG TPA: glutathione transferase [Myxococcaceae bacterium]|nr:glutathione transferase [Myxococcaceae bacterium]
MADLTLWVDAFWISPYAFSSFVALEEKQLAYDVEEVAMHRTENRAPEYARRSLTARVPMLRHRDLYLSESSAIAEYLEEAFPGTPRLLPDELHQRARARQVMAWVRSDLMPIREERSAETIFYAPATAPLSEKAQQAAAKLLAGVNALLVPGATSLFGKFSIADADLTFMLQRLGKSGHRLGDGVQRFVDAVWSRPSVRKWVDRKRPTFVPY